MMGMGMRMGRGGACVTDRFSVSTISNSSAAAGLLAADGLFRAAGLSSSLGGIYKQDIIVAT